MHCVLSFHQQTVMIKLWWNNKGRLNHFEGKIHSRWCGKSLTEPLICAELCCLKDMATRCPFGWKSRFQSNLSILEAKNVSAPCATQETLGQTLLRDTFTALYRALLWVFCLQFCHYNYILLILFTNIKPYIFFPWEKLSLCLCEQDLSSPINIAIDGSVLPYFSPACSLSASVLFSAKIHPSLWT